MYVDVGATLVRPALHVWFQCRAHTGDAVQRGAQGVPDAVVAMHNASPATAAVESVQWFGSERRALHGVRFVRFVRPLGPVLEYSSTGEKFEQFEKRAFLLF